MRNKKDNLYKEYERKGLFGSLFIHLFLLYCVVFGIGFGPRLADQVIYSVSIEGSNKLGGISQVAKTDKKTPIAPPKKVSQKSQPEEKPEQNRAKLKEVTESKKEVVKKTDPDAEVSTAKKETPKEEKKEVQKKEEVKEEKKVEKKPEPTPVKKKAPPKPKKDPVKDANENFENALQRYLGESTNAGGTGFGGDGRGGTGMGGGVVKPPEWFLYKDQLEMAIKRGWNWHDPNSALIATVEFRIAQDGAVSGVRLVSGSGNSFYDESIVRAVRKASPVPAPPARFYDDFKYVQLDFEPR